MAKEFNGIMILISRALLGLLGAIAGYQFGGPWLLDLMGTSLPSGQLSGFILTVSSVLIFALIGLLVAPLFALLVSSMGTLIEKQLQGVSWSALSTGIAGLFFGLLMANLLAIPFFGIPLGPYAAVLLNVLIGYVAAQLFVKRQQDIAVALLGLRQKLNLKRGDGSPEKKPPKKAPHAGGPGKVLDTSVIIDGRILEIARTGFLQGLLILPRFVLVELQAIADSKDSTRRSRGRRGLDVVKALQELPGLTVQIDETSLKSLAIGTVDAAVVALARNLDAQILTTDYNLNKVAQIQDIAVLNVNDLANALKPELLPGDVATVEVLREGKDAHQGVGYLENGTMLVVEDGGGHIGKTVEVTVTSMLQTSAGRMVFGRIRREGRR